MNDYYAKYLAYELTRRYPSDSVDNFARTLSEAQVDLNPHQVDAALFAFRSPFSKGAILADEVGLGKTIEAGILLSQKWAERRRKLLIICPASLRKQWAEELEQKFFLPSVIFEKASFDAAIKPGRFNPFDQDDRIVICSLHFARSKAAFIKGTAWDLIVVDEAHRLRNVYKPTAKIANIIKDAIKDYRKVLLTATPLQNSLLELYGLVSIVDEQAFGSLESFKLQFGNQTEASSFRALKNRMKPVMKRTLRRDVQEYVQYTQRLPMTESFSPTPQEAELYQRVSEYLQEDSLFALPASQRKLMTMIVRKLLASSSYAISGTLASLAKKLQDELSAQAATTEPALGELAPGYEGDVNAEEWVDDDEEAEVSEGKSPVAKRLWTEAERAMAEKEVALLKDFERLAEGIVKNSKGEALLTALEKGFAKARELGAPEKAVIFTESTRTQDYLLRLFENSPWKGKVMLFNGSNGSPQARQTYQAWVEKHANTSRVSGSRTADTRQALVDQFRHDAQIMIATEAAAEGINLQFCNLVVNYDLPWNPQRIEQRIGRCHRYGQKFDVVVINFINRDNEVDQRVYQLLAEKFKLFEGVFGASDEVLGSIESGVDFEKRISDIYQNCRSRDQIDSSFAQLQHDLELPIQERMEQTRRQLFDNFDEEVHEKLRLGQKAATDSRDRYNRWLWDLARWALRDHADFELAQDSLSFVLKRNPFDGQAIAPGPYRSGRDVDDAFLFRVGHPLAQRLVQTCKELSAPVAHLQLDLTHSGRNLASLQSLVGQNGWLSVQQVSIEGAQTEDHLFLAGVADNGVTLDSEQCRRLLSLGSRSPLGLGAGEKAPTTLDLALTDQKQGLLDRLELRNRDFFEVELDKLERWAEDQKLGLEQELKELERTIKESRRLSLAAATLAEKVAQQQRIGDLRGQLNRKRAQLFEAQDAVDAKHQQLVEETQEKLKQLIQVEKVLEIRWTLI